MGKLYKHADKAVLQKYVWEYRRRKDLLREKYSVVRFKAAPEEYKHESRNLTRKIKYWSKVMSNIDKRSNQLIALSNAMFLFLGVNVKNSNSLKSSRLNLGRNIFYKYCLENGISATLLAEYVGVYSGAIVSRARKRFTQSFDKIPNNRETYHRFKIYVEEYLSPKSGAEGGTY